MPDIIAGLQLFKSLIKDGCEWHGDIISSRWSERLIIPNSDIDKKIKTTLSAYREGVDYKRIGYDIWVI